MCTAPKGRLFYSNILVYSPSGLTPRNARMIAFINNLGKYCMESVDKSGDLRYNASVYTFAIILIIIRDDQRRIYKNIYIGGHNDD